MFKAHYIFITILILNIFLAATPVVVASASSPAENPLCWLKNTCEKGQGEDKGEFCDNNKKCPDEAGQCPGEWGFCYPAPAKLKTSLQVPIGGYTTISNASQYIRTVYQVSLGVAVTAAIVILMIAGFRWMTAAGNASVIGQAKTMILSAIIGLVLLFGASLLFQTINPDIIKLTLPRFPKLRPKSLAQTTWCDQLFEKPDEAKQFAYAGEAPNIKKPDGIKAGDFREKTKIGFLQEKCKDAWYPLDKPNTACYSRKCDNSTQICLLDEVTGAYGCKDVRLGGQITTTKQVKNVNLWQVCNNGRVARGIVALATTIPFPDAVATVNTSPSGGLAYYFKDRDIALDDPEDCQTLLSTEKGFVLAIEIEESPLNTTYALKRSGDSCTILSDRDDVYDMVDELYNAPVSIFFQRDELIKSGGGGLRCDITF